MEEGIYEEVSSVAWKRVLSWEVSEAMRKEGITKSEMAKRMKTSRTQLERLLDPDNPNVLLETVQKAAAAVGKRMTIGLVDAPPPGALP
jgi:antitoxin HicB